MKKIYFLMFVCVIGSMAQATVFTVTVTNFQFSPQNIPNVVVGDVISFVWGSGNHTTTCNPATQGAVNSLPAGAATWDAPITMSNTSFNYTVTTAGTYNYYCKVHGAGMAGTFTASGATPVTLTGFTVNNANNFPMLSWKTSSELNTAYFSVRKSNDGTNYKEVGRVPAAGISNTERSYSFTDNQISKNEKYIYYLLYSVDLDSKIQISETRIFKNPLALSKLIIAMGPNPIPKPGHLIVKFNADKTGEMSATVINMQGKTVFKIGMSAVAGINNGHIHMGDLPPGPYTIRFNLNGLVEKYKVIVN